MFFSRSIIYLATIMAIVLTVGSILSFVLACNNVDLGGNGLTMIIVSSILFGFVGSFISLFLSKIIVKFTMRVRVIKTPMDMREKWLIDTIGGLSHKLGVGMPEVGIYEAYEMNAFATGYSKNNSLVAVSTGLLENMEQDEIEAVLGHEMSHVVNGDMVTQTLLQGVINTFVYVFSAIIALLLTSKNSNASSRRSMFRLVNMLVQIVLAFLGMIIISWFSRKREYAADEGSAQILGKQPMINALQKLKFQTLEPKPDGVKAFCICGFISFRKLFATHPPLDDRIQALRRNKFLK